MSEADKVVK